MSRFLSVIVLASCLAGTASAEEPVVGLRLFQEKCATCHEEFPGGHNKTGPALFGVIGRRVGTAPGFAYSEAFQAAAKSGDVWTRKRLDAYLDEPMRMYPHTGMAVLFVNPDDKAALVDYLMTRRPGG